MGVTVVTPATSVLLTTLARVKAELGVAVSETDDDAVLTDMIARASSEIARETRRVFGAETVTETLDGTGTRLLGLARTPILTVTTVTEDGTTITDYSVEDADAGALYRADGWGRSGGLRMWGTEAFSSGYILPGYQDQRYSVTYRAGYTLPDDDGEPTLPGAVEQACLEAVKAWYGQREGGGEVSSLQIGQLRVGFRSNESMATHRFSLPQAALGLLRNHYARVV